MFLYRYEMKDGGGPWCTPDGYLREGDYKENIDDGTKYAMTSIFSLFNYFKDKNIDLSKCRIVIYDIPIKDIVFLKFKNEVRFPKYY